MAARAIQTAMAAAAAWWRGDPVPDAPSHAAGLDADPLGAPAGGPASGEPLADPRLEALRQVYEMDAEAGALEHAWGPGRMAPGDDDDDVRQVQTLTLSDDKTLAWLGAGLGAQACAVARARGVYVQAYEWRPGLARRGQAVCAAAGLGRKLVLDPVSVDPELTLQKRHDAAVCIERLTEFADPASVLTGLRAAMRDGSLGLFVEAVAEDAAPAPEFAGAFPRGAAGLADVETWRARLEAGGFSIRVAEEVTGPAVARLQAGWAGAGRVLADAGALAAEAPHLRAGLARLAMELAAAKLRLNRLEAGDLAVYRFLATAG